jgi:hypothetical protein
MNKRVFGALLVCWLAGCGADSNDTVVAPNACADIFAGPQVSIEGRDVTTLASRAAAFDDLQARVGYVEPIFGPQGRISGLFAYNDNGLTRMQPGESMAATARRFVMENPGLFDLQNAGINSPDKLNWLKPGEERWGPLGDGQLDFEQYYRGVPVWGGIQVSFWDDRMISWSGMLVNPCEDIVDPKPTLSRRQATELARQAVEKDCGAPVSVTLGEAEVYLDAPSRLLYMGTATSLPGGSGWCNYSGSVDAHSGEVSFRNTGNM